MLSAITGYTLPAVDSCNLLIELSKVEILSDRLNSSIATMYLQTGEIENPRQNPDLKAYEDDYSRPSICFKLTKAALAIGRVKEFLSITLNAKMLGERYLEGITEDNLRLVYDYIMEPRIVRFSYEDFLEAMVWDVDIKVDFNTNHGYNELCNAMNASVANQYKVITKRTKGKKNQGLQVSRRDTAKHPMLKTYHKGLELQNNSIEFAIANKLGKWESKTIGTSTTGEPVTEKVFQVNLSHPYRLEATLLRKKQMKELELLDGGSPNTLGNVTSQANLRGMSVMEALIDRYMPDPIEVKEPRKASTEKAEKELRKITACVKTCLDAGYGKEKTIQRVLETFEPANAYKARFKRMAGEVWCYMDELISEVETKKLTNRIGSGIKPSPNRSF